MAKITHSILIIDDEKEILKALERTLRSVAQIYTAPSGAVGLKILKKKDISLILCDQRMPEMTGINFFKKIHKTYPDTVRIILTAYTDIEDLIEAINQVGGLNEFVTEIYIFRDEEAPTISLVPDSSSGAVPVPQGNGPAEHQESAKKDDGRSEQGVCRLRP